MIKPRRLEVGDTIGIIAPSRPITHIKKELGVGIKLLEAKGFKVKFGRNLDKKLYYSAGSAKERASDLNAMFRDKSVKVIICATGGITSNQILDLIDYEAIKKNPKIFLGYSDITTLLSSIHKKTGLIVFHGTDLCDLHTLSARASDFLFDMLMGKWEQYILPTEINVIKKGNARGRLAGGNLVLNNALLGTNYSPSFNKAIWFWEEAGECPAALDHALHQFKLSGNLDKISAMVIGFLSDCVDKKYKEDNRPIEEIVLELTKGYDFPIIKVPYFGHDTSDFYTLPIGAVAEIGTMRKEFKIIESPVQ